MRGAGPGHGSEESMKTVYAVPWREEGETKWRGLAQYPFCDDPTGAERIKAFLEETRALPFEYALATVMIDEPASSAAD